MFVKKRLALSAAVISLLFCIPVAGCHRTDSAALQTQKRNASIAASLEKSGVLTKGEYLRIVSLDEAISSGDTLSEIDTDWLLSLPNKPGTPYQTGLRLLHASTVFKHGKAAQFPTSRQPQIFDMAVRMLAYKKETVTTAVPYSGCIVLGVLGDPKAIPTLKGMLGSPHWEVRDMARSALEKIQKRAGG